MNKLRRQWNGLNRVQIDHKWGPSNAFRTVEIMQSGSILAPINMGRNANG